MVRVKENILRKKKNINKIGKQAGDILKQESEHFLCDYISKIVRILGKQCCVYRGRILSDAEGKNNNI